MISPSPRTKNRLIELLTLCLIMTLTFVSIVPNVAPVAQASDYGSSWSEPNNTSSNLAAASARALQPALMMPTSTFSNASVITIPASGTGPAAASPYPSDITVSGMTGAVTDVSVTLTGVTHQRIPDVEILLVGPAAAGSLNYILFSDIAGAAGVTSVSGLNFTINDAAASQLPCSTTPVSGTFKPTDYGSGLACTSSQAETWPAPAPAGPYNSPGPNPAHAPFETMNSVYAGIDPNGTWSLYVFDDSGGNIGTISGGWSITITTANVAATTTTVTSNNNPSYTTAPNSSVTLTANVSSTSTVNEGTVTFTDNGVNIAGCINVAVVSGQAQCTTSFATEGNHPIVAAYSGTANFSASNGSLNQVAKNHSTNPVAGQFCNPGAITMTDISPPASPASPYPSYIDVTGLSGTISNVTVNLNNINHTKSNDIDILLVGPGGLNAIIMSDTGGPNPATGVNLLLSDAAGSPLPGDAGPALSSGTFQPTNAGGAETYPNAVAPNPNPPVPSGGSALSVFNGAAANGEWRLYVIDDSGGSTGSIGNWCLNITAASAAPTTTSVVSNNNPSFTTAPNNSVTFTATVVDGSSNPVTEGTVTFTDNGSNIAGCVNVAVNGSGQAQCTTTFSTEGNHDIDANYNGTVNFAPSSGSVNQVVNNHTTVNGSQYCNTGNLVINDFNVNGGRGTPYPSNIFVTGGGPSIRNLTVTLNNVTHGGGGGDDLDFLLVGPTGQKFILVGDAGGLTPINNVTVTFDDASASVLPDTGGWGSTGASVTSKPVNYAGGDSFPAPAPAAPYLDPGPTPPSGATLASAFNTTNPNGTWNLYVFDDSGSGGVGGNVAGGWCLNIDARKTPLDFDGDGITDYAVIEGIFPRPDGQKEVMVSEDILTDPRQRVWTKSYNKLLHLRSGRGFVALPREVQGYLAKQGKDDVNLLDAPLPEGVELTWHIRLSNGGITLDRNLGSTSDEFVPADYDGDGKADIAVWGGTIFRVLTSSSNFVTEFGYTLGGPGDDPTVVGDYDGDGLDDPAVYNSTTGVWSWLGGAAHNVPGSATWFAGGIPAPGDYNGDGKYDFALQIPPNSAPDTAKFRIAFNDGSVGPAADISLSYGLAVYAIVPGDYDGDGKTDIAQANLTGTNIVWRVLQSSTNYTVQIKKTLGVSATDRTVQGDYDGDGKIDFAIYKRATAPNDGVFIYQPITAGAPSAPFDWGDADDYPVAFFNTH